ncbi:MAG: hypothetical protein V7642_2852 [Burkholderiales bacterium]|jgi:hypothetical protein
MTVAWRVVSIVETGGTRVLFRSMMAPKFDVRGCGIDIDKMMAAALARLNRPG